MSKWTKKMACPDCGYTRPVRLGSNATGRCRPCSNKLSVRDIPSGKGNGKWKGGRHKNSKGYIEVLVPQDSPFRPMAPRSQSRKSGYVLEHRLVIAQSLGRCLETGEVVHHKNGVRDDNRLENLELHPLMAHWGITHLETKMDKLLEENKELKTEIRLLRFEIRNAQKKEALI